MESPEITPMPAAKSSNNKMLIVGIVIIMALVICFVCAGIYLFTQLTANNTPTASTTTTTTPVVTTTNTTSGTTVITNQTTLVDLLADIGSCGLTEQATEGPYYVTGTEELDDGNLNSTGLPGTPIKIAGYVYDGEDNSTPIAGAKVEIWQADNSGVYHPNSNGDVSKYSESKIALRGYVLTNADGYYEYTTIYPGHYNGRTRHIHTNTTADGFTGVITQLIVPIQTGDADTPSTDQIAKSLPTCNQITFSTVDGMLTSVYNYHLAAK